MSSLEKNKAQMEGPGREPVVTWRATQKGQDRKDPQGQGSELPEAEIMLVEKQA